jgi:hypothetical protein
MEQFIDFIGPIFDILLTFALVICMVIQIKIMARQRDIMNEQNNILPKMNESDKVADMLDQYFDLHEERRLFWMHLQEFHNESHSKSLFRGEKQNISDLIDGADLPPGFEPSTEMNLRRFIEDNQQNWKTMDIWIFSQSVVGHKNHAFVYETLPRLAYFWDNWAFVIDSVEKYRQPDPRELLMLTWLEFAKLMNTDDYSARCGKVHLFRLARNVWEPYKKLLKPRRSDSIS